MNPDIFTFGDLRFPAYPSLMVLAFILGWTIGMIDAKKQGFNPWRALEVGLISTFSGVIGARILYVILQWNNFKHFPELIFMIRFAGLSVLGAIIGAFLSALLWSRWRGENLFRYTDLMAPYWGLGYGIVRIGCFFGGCCYGKVTDLPWAVTMVQIDALSRHPVQLYASLGAFIGLTIVILLRRVCPFHGFLTLTAFSLYGILRFTTEFFRHGEVYWMGFTNAQLASAALFFLSTAAIIVLYRLNLSQKNKGFSG